MIIYRVGGDHGVEYNPVIHGLSGIKLNNKSISRAYITPY